jgi:hypothetical protein
MSAEAGDGKQVDQGVRDTDSKRATALGRRSFVDLTGCRSLLVLAEELFAQLVADALFGEFQEALVQALT